MPPPKPRREGARANGAPRTLAPTEILDFVRGTLFDERRRVPVVAVTTSGETGKPWVDPGRVARVLGEHAQVVVVETGDATWTLTAALPDMLDVYGGALRVWWPKLTPRSDPSEHPLIFVRSLDGGERALRRLAQLIRPGEDLFPTPWRRVAQEYKTGDVVWGLVERIKPFGVFVELLPGVVGLVHTSEVDWTYVKDPGEFVKPGEQVAVQIMTLDPTAERATLSIKRALNRTPKAPIAPRPGGKALLIDGPVGGEGGGGGAEEGGGADKATEEGGGQTKAAAVEALEDEIATLREDRTSLLGRIRDLQKQVRSASDRIAHLERQPGVEGDPSASANAFLLAVRLAYARQFAEGERHDYPLKPMRVGPEFLDRLRTLEGVSLDKVVEVCAQVAAGRAHEIPAREVHRLHGAERGAGGIERARDDAKAWRCSLQDNTPSARRLHWWSIPGGDGGSVEFASVGVHDDYRIPG